MIVHRELEPKFVKGVPRDLEPGVLYVSMEYGTVVHSCCCGCGQEVVTPLTPTDWRLTFDGEGISLWPSVGNWNLPCQSHYVITDNQVTDAGPWSKARIEREQARDKLAKAKFYGKADAAGPSVPHPARDAITPPVGPTKGGLVSKIAQWWRR